LLKLVEPRALRDVGDFRIARDVEVEGRISLPKGLA
jgi:hypothetical protein